MPLSFTPFSVVSNAIVRFVLEPTCAACDAPLGRPLASPVCASCWLGVVRVTPPCCVRCGEPRASWRDAQPLCARCRRRETSIAIARSAARYEGSLRLILHAFKYGNRRLLAAPLAALMVDAAEELLRDADAVVPVPLHPWRAWQRGFNQADDLARHVGPPVWRVLRRTRHGPPQAGLPAAQRHANVRAAFALRRGPPGTKLRHRVVVLIDDVMTTGATLEACATVLREAGVRSVRALTVARAAAARPGAPALPLGPSMARR